MRTLQVDIEGLDLVLGGGFSLLERVKGAGESATLLVRGPAGSGKTVFGTHVAASIARALNTDVAYGCVELLPAELHAQHESLRAKASKERVVILNEGEVDDPEPTHVRIYAGLLDLGDDGRTVERFGDSVELLLEMANSRAGRKVQVVVIDSLSDGYGLGAKAPRVLADGISKLAAERGLVIILLEEQADEGTSVWSFAVDTVFELKPAQEGLPFERRLLIPKNRLGPSDPGPHEFMVVRHQGISIYPRVNAYQRSWRNEFLHRKMPASGTAQAWYPNEFSDIRGLPEFRRSTVAVIGSDPVLVKRLAWSVGSKILGSTDGVKDFFGPELSFRVGVAGSFRSTERDKENPRGSLFFGWSPLQSGAVILSRLRWIIENQYSVGKIPLRVMIGDLRDIQHHADRQGMVQAIAIVSSLLRDLEVPLVLYETIGENQAASVAVNNANVVLTYVRDEEDESGARGIVVVDSGSRREVCSYSLR